MTANVEPDRHIAFEGALNFRDLGGYVSEDGRSVKWRHLYRSDHLQRLTDVDVTKARRDLGIRTVIDLRQPDRTAREGEHALVQPPVQYKNIPLGEENRDDLLALLNSCDRLSQAMLQWLSDPAYGQGMVSIMREIAQNEEGPLVFHCTGGHHRAGLIAAMVLGLLGVPQDIIAQDYALTELSSEARMNSRSGESFKRFVEQMNPIFFQAIPETMHEVLDALSRDYGSIRGYAEAHGADQQLLTQLGNALLE